MESIRKLNRVSLLTRSGNLQDGPRPAPDEKLLAVRLPRGTADGAWSYEVPGTGTISASGVCWISTANLAA